jgi:methenyltetrahydrofolate cyclohydrolase
MLIKKNVEEFIQVTASGEPTPGGGSISALAGSLGAALTRMVGNLSFGKKAYEELSDENKAKLEENFKVLEEKMGTLTEIIDTDSTAFDGVMKAFKMPKSTDEEKKARSEAIQAGYKEALEVPLNCGEICLDVLELQKEFAHYGNINAITDIGVGALLAYTGLEGALLNVKINLQSIKDEAYVKETQDKVEKLLNDGKELKEELMKIVYKRLG